MVSKCAILLRLLGLYALHSGAYLSNTIVMPVLHLPYGFKFCIYIGNAGSVRSHLIFQRRQVGTFPRC